MNGPEPRFPRALLWAIVAAALLAHGASLSNGFVNYDDDAVRHEAATKGLLDLWTGPFYYAYKPVYATSLWIDERLFGDAPLGWHVGNVALFALACVLAALVVHGMTRSRFLGAAAGLLLATHPIHAENVAWVAERKDVLSLALVLLAHLAWRASRAKHPSRVPVGALVLLALGGLAKGTVWTYAGVIALDEAFAPRAKGRGSRFLALAAVGALGIGVDAWFGAAYGPGAVRHDATTLGLVAAMAGVHARYLASLVWPAGLSADYPVDPAGSFADPWALAGIALAVLAVVGLVVGIRRKRPLLAIACGLWVLGLAPVNNVWPTTSVLRADRYLLVPALGVYLLVGALLARLRGAAPAAVAALAVALGVLAAHRAEAWADSETLWTDAVAKQPRSAIAWLSRAQARQAKGEWVGVEDDARRGIAAAESLRRPELVVRGRLLRSLALLTFVGKPEALAESLREANEAVRSAEGLVRSPLYRDPKATLASAHAHVAQALVERARRGGDADQAAVDLKLAEAEFGRAVEADPESFEAQLGLGNLLAATGGKAGLPRAAQVLRTAHRLLPGEPQAVVPLVTVLFDLRLDAEANAVFDEALARRPEDRDLLMLRARLAEEGERDPEAAERYYRRVLARSPSDGEARRRLAGLEARRGAAFAAQARTTHDKALLSKAVEAFDRALDPATGDPSDADTVVAAGDALLGLGRFRDARERYHRAATLKPAAAWIRTHEARAGVLEAIGLGVAGLEDEAAKTMAAVVRLAPPRIDLGETVLEAEVLWLVPAADALDAGDPAERVLATGLLRGTAALLAGDDGGALATFAKAAGTLGGAPPRGSRLESLADATYLLRALGKEHRADFAEARDDLRLVEPHRAGDALLAYRLLLLDREEAAARLRVAVGGGDAAETAKARAEAAEVSTRIRAYAEKDAAWPGPGLLAAETEIEDRDHLAALRRLSALAERFPESPAVRRGFAAVYQAQALEASDRSRLLAEAQKALLVAKRLDPRDARTALDLSQVYRLLGNLDAAALYAVEAASVEPTPGPATHALVAILVEKGRKALDAKDGPRALDLAKSARAADPAAAGPEILEGDVRMAAGDWEKALAAYREARRKEPASRAAREALAACQRRRGGAYLVWRLAKPRPVAKDGVPPDPKLVLAWEKHDVDARRQARADLEESLKLVPEGEDADAARRSLEIVLGLDPAEQRLRALAAQKAFSEGEALSAAKKRVDALYKYREAAKDFPNELKTLAWIRVAEACVDLGSAYDVEGLDAVETVRQLRGDAQYPRVELYEGEIQARRSAAGEVGAREMATAALKRYLDRTSGDAAKEAEGRKRAEYLLDRLAKGR